MLSVAAGKVVLAAGQWLGGADIAATADFEVESACGSEVFGTDDLSANHAALAVGGRLTRGEGVDAYVKSMSIGGARVYGRKTHGSSSSGARCQDEASSVPNAYKEIAGEEESRTPPPEYPMKWHKFLMVVMIIGAIFMIINGASLLTGTEYSRNGADAETVYRLYPGLKACDIFYGAVLIAIGVFEFIVRNRLNQFRQNGPFSLKILYGLSITASILYMLWFTSVTSSNAFTNSNLASLATSVALLIINSSYYAKRSELFVN